jgi:subtilase family serine protease
VTFEAFFRNAGAKESGPFNIRFIADGTPDPDQERPRIPAGETHTHAAVLKNLSAGEHTLEFIADPDNRIPESNEENNRDMLSFTLQVRDCSERSGKRHNGGTSGDPPGGGGEISEPNPGGGIYQRIV